MSTAARLISLSRRIAKAKDRLGHGSEKRGGGGVLSAEEYNARVEAKRRARERRYERNKDRGLRAAIDRLRIKP